ncbi:unnamed protein product [Symbiodinium necroappetens]|uniref:Uncharacterized protein n=1 Tax=Symbiodinium necroappetens TaxID=1628268 RepID=A0A812X5Y2_9DINO|nr:unnamed protein product [Symbiodinium necroappetens]
MSNTASEMDLDAQQALFFGHMGPLRKSPPPTSGAPGASPSHQAGAKRQQTDADPKDGKRDVPGSHDVGIQQWFKARAGGTLGERRHDVRAQGVRDSRGVARIQGLQAHSTGPEAGTDPCLPPSGHGDASLHEERGVGDDTSFVRCSDQVANHQGGGADQAELLPQTGALQAAADHAARTVVGDEPEGGSNGPRQVAWLGGCRAELADVAMESRPTTLEVDPTVRAVPSKDLLSQLVQMRRGSTEETILRFHSLRHLSPAVKADWIQFQLVVSLRPNFVAFSDRHWSQHSVFLLRLHQQGFQGSWEARRHIDGVTRVTDRGTTLAPVILALHAGPQLILQSMIDQWHTQASVHALTQPTTIGQPRFGKDRAWLSDDGRVPEPIQREHDSAVYLLWLMQATDA